MQLYHRRLRAAFALVVAALPWATNPARGQAPLPLSQIIAEGIGKRFPPSPSLVDYSPWPMPLREAPGAMMTAAISRDGRAAATGSGHPNQSGELVVWDAETGRQRWIRPFSRGIRSVAITSDARHVVAGSFDGVARLFDAASGALLREFRGHTDAINAIALSSDDRLLATGSHDQTVIVWSLADGARRHTLRGHTGDVLTVAISPRGNLLASAGRDNTARLWNLETGEALHTLGGHEGLIEMVAFSPDDGRLATASWDGTLRIWDVKTGAHETLLRRPTRFTSVAFAPQGKEIWGGGFDGQLVAWTPDAQMEPRSFPAQEGAVYAVALSADGGKMVTCGFEGTARLWRGDGTLLHKLDRQLSLTGEARSVTAAAWSKTGEQLATVHGDAVLRLTRVSSGQQAAELRLAGERIAHVAIGRDDEQLLVATDSGSVFRWGSAAQTPSPVKVASHGGPIAALLAAPDGSSFITAGKDGAFHIHRLPDGKLAARATADSPIHCAALDARGIIVTGHDDGRVRLWNLAGGKEIASEIRQSSGVRAVAVSPDTSTLAIATGASIDLWQLSIEKGNVSVTRRRALTLPEGEVSHLAFSPGGEQLVSGDTSGQIRLWSLAGGAARTLARKHVGGATALAIAPDSNALFTAGADQAVWIWQPNEADESIRPLASIPAHDKGTRYVALARDARLVSDGYDNHVRVWNLATGQEERDLGVPDSASACVLLASGTHVAVGHWSKRIQLVELATGRRLDNIRGLPRGPYAIDVSPDQRYMAAAFRELGATVYDLQADEADPLVTLPPDELPFTHVAFSPDGSSFVTCTGDYQRMQAAGKVRLHEVKTGKVIRDFVGHSSEVKMAAFDRAGNRLATCGGDKTVRIWDVSTGRMLALFPHPIGTFAPLFVEGSDLVIAADYHGKVYFWDLTKTAPAQVVAAHTDMINRLALSDDRTVLATASRDGTVRLWKLAGERNELRIVSADQAQAP